jgi:chemotaxis protein MotB
VDRPAVARQIGFALVALCATLTPPRTKENAVKRLALALCVALSVGCVAKSKYLALEDQYSSSQAQVTEQQARIDKLEADLAKSKKLAQAAAQKLEELRREFQPLVDRGVLEVTVDEGRIVIGMKADVLFPSGSAELSAEGRDTITQVARLLAKRTDREFQVEGHTDSDPIASDAFPSNWHLGSARAINVVQVMIAAGMAPDQISAATFAATRPVAENDDAVGKAQNRRIEVVLLPDLSALPTYDALMEQGRPPRKGPKGHRPPPKRR